MRSVSTLVLLTVAVSAGAAVYYYPEMGGSALDIRRQSAGAGSNSGPAVDPAAQPAAAGPRVFSAQTPLYGSTVPAPVPAQRRNPQVAETAVVGTDPIMRSGTSNITTSSTEKADASGPQTKEEAARTVATALHKELKRVGCYSGEISGDWTAASKKAMRAFLERVNAKLPVEQPDHILLTMVKGHATEACGKGCPVGQMATDDGSCVPRQVVAKATAPTSASTAKDPAAATKETAETKTPPRGKVATFVTEVVPAPAAQPSPPAGNGTPRAPEKVAQSSSWTTEVAPATAETVPAGAAPTAAPTTVLPGRMTLGAVAPQPVPVTPQSTSPPAPVKREPAEKPAPVKREPAEKPAVEKVPVPKARVAATTTETPPPVAVSPPKTMPRPAPQPQERPQAAAPQRKVVERSTYVAPSYRLAPSRDWKSTVFNNNR